MRSRRAAPRRRLDPIRFSKPYCLLHDNLCLDLVVEAEGSDGCSLPVSLMPMQCFPKNRFRVQAILQSFECARVLLSWTSALVRILTPTFRKVGHHRPEGRRRQRRPLQDVKKGMIATSRRKVVKRSVTLQHVDIRNSATAALSVCLFLAMADGCMAVKRNCLSVTATRR